MIATARESLAVVSALIVYRGGVVPLVRGELGHWRGVAATIPDSTPRTQALAALDEKALDVEATALFAILASRRTRAAATGAMVALQVAIDYLDTLGEQRSAPTPVTSIGSSTPTGAPARCRPMAPSWRRSAVPSPAVAKDSSTPTRGPLLPLI